MKKNRRTYLLLACVLVIWGLLGFKVIKAVAPNDSPITTAKQTVPFTPRGIVKKDTFSIVANYRDPFLGTYPKKAITVKKPFKKKTDVPDKDIAYTGYIRDEKSDKTLYFVTIQDQQYMMSPGEEQAEVTLIKGNATQILISYGGIRKTIQKMP